MLPSTTFAALDYARQRQEEIARRVRSGPRRARQLRSLAPPSPTSTMNTATTAGVLSTIIFAASTLPMVRARCRDARRVLLQPQPPAHDQRRQRRAHRLRRQPAAGPGLAAALHLQLCVCVHVRGPRVVEPSIEVSGFGSKHATYTEPSG